MQVVLATSSRDYTAWNKIKSILTVFSANVKYLDTDCHFGVLFVFVSLFISLA